MRSKVIPNLANSGKSTSLLSYGCLSLASKAPHMTGLYTRPLLRVPEYSCCAKLTTLLWRALMKTSPSIYVIRLVKPYNCYLKIRPHSSTSASSKTSTDLMLRSILTPSSSHVEVYRPCPNYSWMVKTFSSCSLEVFRPFACGWSHLSICSSGPSREHCRTCGTSG